MTTANQRRLTTWTCAPDNPHPNHHACDRDPRLLSASMGPQGVCECACHDAPRQPARQSRIQRQDERGATGKRGDA